MEVNMTLPRLLIVLCGLVIGLPPALAAHGLPATPAAALAARDAGPGTDGAVALCSNGPAIQLIAHLGGTPEPGGTWSGPAAHPGTFDPATDAPGVYTYTVTGPPVASATVTVTVHDLPWAGTNGAVAVCANGAPVNLFSQLTGAPDAGGAWTFGGDPASGTFTPGTSAAGIYTYTVSGTAPCPDASATVTVAVHALPDAGTSSTLTVCSNAPAVDLFGQLGGAPDPGGAWTLAGDPVSNIFTPGTSAAGTYTYTVNGTPPCPNATATVVVTVEQAPNAGNNRSITICSNDAP